MNVDVSLLQCLSDSEFVATDDICIMNPKNCENGLSASMFCKLEFEVDQNDLETNFTKQFTREYILSKGNESNNARELFEQSSFYIVCIEFNVFLLCYITGTFSHKYP